MWLTTSHTYLFIVLKYEVSFVPKINRLFCALYYTFVILSEQVGNKITVDKKTNV